MIKNKDILNIPSEYNFNNDAMLWINGLRIQNDLYTIKDNILKTSYIITNKDAIIIKDEKQKFEKNVDVWRQ